MAKCEIKFPTDFEIKIDTLGKNLDKICGEVCEAGADVVLPKVRSNLKSSIGHTQEKSRSTGELLSSLGVSEPKVDRNGMVNVKIGFHEPRKTQHAAKGKRSYYQITNAMVANVLEHGKHGQPARPFMAKAKRQSKKACEAAMKAKMEEEVNKI